MHVCVRVHVWRRCEVCAYGRVCVYLVICVRVNVCISAYTKQKNSRNNNGVSRSSGYVLFDGQDILVLPFITCRIQVIIPQDRVTQFNKTLLRSAGVEVGG